MTVTVNENSYISLSDANTYFENRLYTEAWDNTSSDESEKEIALIWACNLLEKRVKWYGAKTDSSQTLQWPRQGLVNLYRQAVDSSSIPQSVKAVQCELALYLLENNPMTINTGIEKMDIEGLTMNLKNSGVTIPHKIFSPIKIFGELLDNPGTYRVTR